MTVFQKTLSVLGLLCLTAGVIPSVALANNAIAAQNYQEPTNPQPIHVTAQPVERVEISQGAPASAMVAIADTQRQQRFLMLSQFILNYNRKLSYEQASTMAEAIVEFSERYHVDFRLVTGVIAVESSFRSDAISSSGAIGLGQLKPDTAKWLGVANPYDPVDNIAGMTRYLSWLMRKYNGSLDHAVSAYFQGPGTVDRQGITPNCVYYLGKINTVLSRMI